MTILQKLKNIFIQFIKDEKEFMESERYWDEEEIRFYNSRR